MKVVGVFYNETYQANIRIINPTTDRQLRAYLRRYPSEEIEPSPHFIARAGYIEGNFHWIAVRDKWDDSTLQLSFLAHEATHVTEDILWPRDLDHCIESREAWAYLQAEIFRRALQILRKE